MPLIQNPLEKPIPIMKGNSALTSRLSSDDLPRSYYQLVSRQNGGYMENMRFSTAEPTSDGLNYGLIHYILGLHEETSHGIFQQQRNDLPDYFIVFSANEQQLFAFDYSVIDDFGEPAIRYLDLETDNWQTVAPNLAALLEKTNSYQMEIPLVGKMTLSEAEHSLLLAKDAAYLENLWLHLEDGFDKQWLFNWLAFFAEHTEDSFRKTTLQALETQLLYFRLQLPKNAEDVLDLFLSDEKEDLCMQAEILRKEYKDN